MLQRQLQWVMIPDYSCIYMHICAYIIIYVYIYIYIYVHKYVYCTGGCSESRSHPPRHGVVSWYRDKFTRHKYE